MIRQQIAISGLGGQGVLFLTRILAETGLSMGLDVISSETHGMAMRGGAVISHLKTGAFASPLIRSGRADVALYLAEENLKVHPNLIGPHTRVVVNSPSLDGYESCDALRIARDEIDNMRAVNLVVLGFALGKGALFCTPEQVKATIAGLSDRSDVSSANLAALSAGLKQASA